MPNSLDQYVRRVREVLSSHPSKTEIVAAVSEAAQLLIEDPPILTEQQRSAPEGGYGRNLLYKDADDGWVVVAMVWPPGVEGPAHDHGVWGVVAVTEGKVRIVNYDRTDDGSDPNSRQLVERERIEAGRGAITTVLPPEGDWHLVGNAADDCLAVSIHTYGADLRRCRAVDLETGKVRTVEMQYAPE